MKELEQLFQEHLLPLKRFVRFKINNLQDAEDIIQEVCLTATANYKTLKNKEVFKAWLLGIASNKCKDYYRKRAKLLELPLEEVSESALGVGRLGVMVQNRVRETLELLGEKEQQILYLYFFKDLPQEEIARQLNLPIGTVKSRLHYAKEKFKAQYPCPPKETKEDRAGRQEAAGDFLWMQPKKVQQTIWSLDSQELNRRNEMGKLPGLLPEYRIEKSGKEPFSVKWEELMGWFLVPKLGESLSWGMYDIPSRKCDYIYNMKVTGRAMVHGIEGVELVADETECRGKKTSTIHRTFIAQLTDTHCRYLATLREENGLKNYITFLDGDEFLENWGFGEDNCGNETNLSPKGDIKREGSEIVSVKKDFLLDIVGRYNVTINGKTYDTVCVMDIETYNAGVVSEQFLDKNGRTILWRRFNKNDWAKDHYGKLWTELLPENERLVINGETYVHWYDCITDYIF